MKHQLRAAALALLLALSGCSQPAAREPVKAAEPEAATVVPVRLDIPRIGLHTRLTRLGRNPDGTVQLPALERDAPAGWSESSAVPGDGGAAVLIGHVDPAHDGPTVFQRLGTLRPGDEVSVRRSDGVTVRFRVTQRRLHRSAPQSHRATGEASLRLVTCGGNFDPHRRRYRSNLVVVAEPV